MHKKLSEISPHQFLTRRRLQIFDDEARERRLLDAVEKEDKWVKEFIGRLATAIREIGSKSIGSSAEPAISETIIRNAVVKNYGASPAAACVLAAAKTK